MKFFKVLPKEKSNLKSACKKISLAIVLKACNFIKKRLQHRCFPMNISKLLRTTILKNNSKRLLQCFCFTLFPGFFVLLGTHKVQMCFKYFSKAQSKMRHSIAICD